MSSPGLVHWACAKNHQWIILFSHTDLCPDYKSYGGFSRDHIKFRTVLLYRDRLLNDRSVVGCAGVDSGLLSEIRLKVVPLQCHYNSVDIYGLFLYLVCILGDPITLSEMPHHITLMHPGPPSHLILNQWAVILQAMYNYKVDLIGTRFSSLLWHTLPSKSIGTVRPIPLFLL